MVWAFSNYHPAVWNKQSYFDNTIFYRHFPQGRIYVIVHVDNIIIIGVL